MESCSMPTSFVSSFSSKPDDSRFSSSKQPSSSIRQHANILLQSMLINLSASVQHIRSSGTYQNKETAIQILKEKKNNLAKKQKEGWYLHIPRAHFLINFPIIITLKSYPYISSNISYPHLDSTQSSKLCLPRRRKIRKIVTSVLTFYKISHN